MDPPTENSGEFNLSRTLNDLTIHQRAQTSSNNEDRPLPSGAYSLFKVLGHIISFMVNPPSTEGNTMLQLAVARKKVDATALQEAIKNLAPASTSKDVPFLELVESETMIKTFWMNEKFIPWHTPYEVLPDDTWVLCQRNLYHAAKKSFLCWPCDASEKKDDLTAILKKRSGYRQYEDGVIQYLPIRYTDILRAKWTKEVGRSTKLTDMAIVTLNDECEEEKGITTVLRLMAAVWLRPSPDTRDQVALTDVHGDVLWDPANEDGWRVLQADTMPGEYMLYYMPSHVLGNNGCILPPITPSDRLRPVAEHARELKAILSASFNLSWEEFHKWQSEKKGQTEEKKTEKRVAASDAAKPVSPKRHKAELTPEVPNMNPARAAQMLQTKPSIQAAQPSSQTVQSSSQTVRHSSQSVPTSSGAAQANVGGQSSRHAVPPRSTERGQE